MIGKFGYRENCSIMHYLPQGEVQDGYPVIVFPKEPSKVVEGKLYEFFPTMTRAATYTIDGQVYRVAHAIDLRDTTGKEGDFVDSLLYHTAGGKKGGTLGDALGSDLRAKLTSLASKSASR